MSVFYHDDHLVICDRGKVTLHGCPWGPDLEAERLRGIGREFGYPECCIEEFVKDVTVRGHHPFMRRMVAIAPFGDGVYVLCYACQDRQMGGLL